MNKQRKRHISEAKFNRVMDMEWDAYLKYDGVPDTFFEIIDESPCIGVISSGFIYWSQKDNNHNLQHYRKSLKEALL